MNLTEIKTILSHSDIAFFEVNKNIPYKVDLLVERKNNSIYK